MSVLVNDLKLPRPIRDEFTDARFRTVQVFGIFKPHRTPNIFPYDVVMMCFHRVWTTLDSEGMRWKPAFGLGLRICVLMERVKETPSKARIA